MKRTRMPGALGVLVALALGGALRGDPPPLAAAEDRTPQVATSDGLEAEVTQGALRITAGGRVVECPLRHTDVQADVSGFIARVRVVQTFENPYDEPIEAVYVFPLPHTAAVDDMTMVLGERRIVGVIRRRAEARALYEQALARGQTASLLEQERPNIFTQSVGNIRARQEVRIEISYVDVLPYDRGSYEFHFPMVVGPRYIPGAPLRRPSTGEGWAADTTRVPDASRVTPPVLKPGERTGHDISLRVRIEAGVPIQALKVKSHEAALERTAASRATAVLAPADAIPNKDFVVTYKVVGPRPETAVLAHAIPGEDGYFLMMMQPRDMEDALRHAPPRDVCFLIDVSGSMSGEPTAKVTEAMRRFFERAKPEDRIQVVTFAGSAARLFDSYVPATPQNVAQALRFTDGLRGGGGTEMLKGIQMVLADPVDPRRVRVVVMLTDGYIGNEAEIIREVGRRAGDQLRFWTIGIGSSPNRFLLDGVARQGGGMSAVLGLKDDPTELVGRIVERIHRAQLSRIELDWGGLEVSETYPARVPELWAGRPVIVLGRYRGAGPTTVRISGLAEGEPASFPLAVSLPEQEREHDVLAKVWARRKIEDLSDQMAVTQGDPAPLEEEITELALRYRLMSAYTSFVAIDEAEGPLAEEPRPPRRIMVPVPLPEGVSYEGIFGELDGADDAMTVMAESVAVGRAAKRTRRNASREPYAFAPAHQQVERRVAGGLSGGVVGGMPAGVVGAQATPPPPAATLNASLGALGYLAPGPQTVQALPDSLGQAAAHQAQAREALGRARSLAEKKDWGGAVRELRLAWLLEDAQRRVQPWADDGTRAAMVEAWERARQALGEAALAAAPPLRKRLDLVVRNASLEEALRIVAGAVGLGVRVEPGSLEDAAALTREPLRVAWLDLRRATAAQALDWLLQPFGLEWTVEARTVVVRSARRAPGLSAWPYEIADVAVPLPAEYGRDAARAATAVPKALREVEQAARVAVAGDSRAAVSLLDAGRLLVVGPPDAHARAAAMLDGLRKGSAPGVSATLAARTAARAAARAGEEDKVSRERALARAASELQQSSWALLAAACQGRVDEESVSRLREALAPDTVAALESRSPALVLRTLWSLAQARAGGPNHPGLRALSEAAFRASAPALRALPARLASRAADEGLYAAAVYLALLQRLPPELVPAGALSASPDLGEVLARAAATGPLPAAAAAVLAGPAEAVLEAVASGRLATEDGAVLAGLALRQAGARHWNAFRDQRAEMVARHAFGAGAVRVLNRLDRARLAGLERRP